MRQQTDWQMKGSCSWRWNHAWMLELKFFTLTAATEAMGDQKSASVKRLDVSQGPGDSPTPLPYRESTQQPWQVTGSIKIHKLSRMLHGSC